MCFLQFLSSQGDMLKFIYDGTAGKFPRLNPGSPQGRRGGPGSVGRCSDTRKCPLHVIVCAHPRGDLLRKSFQYTLKSEEHGRQRTDLRQEIK